MVARRWLCVDYLRARLNDRLRLNVNVTTSRVNNKYIQYENTGGFEGGVFMNAVIFNPTQPIQVSDSTGTHYFEFVGSTSVRNPVAMARELADIGTSTRQGWLKT